VLDRESKRFPDFDLTHNATAKRYALIAVSQHRKKYNSRRMVVALPGLFPPLAAIRCCSSAGRVRGLFTQRLRF